VDWALALDRPTLDEPAVRVGSIMSKHVFTCRASDSVNVAAQIMWDHDCGCVPVLDEKNRPVAVITDRDICMAGLTQGKMLHEICVNSACSRELYKCQQDELVEDVMELMASRQVRRLPVVDADGKLVGMLSVSDLIRHLWFTRSGAIDADSATDMASLLEAVSRPRVIAQGQLQPMSEAHREYLAAFDAP
jgi:CBS domain-containing protein